MKKTLTVNLSGVAFSIYDDAYKVLNSYLIDIENRLQANGEDRETILDIESRIMEIIQENERDVKAVINIVLVKHVISIIGNPSIFGEKSSNSDCFEKKMKITRLMRDPEHRVFGGVCGGLSAYLGVTPTLVRIFLVVSCVLSMSFLAIVYIFLWVALPEATTHEELETLRTKYGRIQ